MTDSSVAEGHVKVRDGKKWKTRWVVLRKPSPVADCLVLLVSKERGVKERSSVVLEHICGLEAGGSSEGVAYSLTILSLNQIVQLGFDSKEALLAWDLRLRYYLGEVHSFKVTVLPGTKLETGLATLHLCNNLLVIARDTPPVISGQWNLLDLRRYGPVPNGFVFEGGTRCGYWAGVFFLSCAEGEQISFLFDCIVRGISPSRAPFGIKPLLPDPSASAASAEERLNQEAEELEKRLSRLSHNTASTSSFSSSVAGDDRSISGSSDSETSHSDSSISSRLTLWVEPVPTATADSTRTASHGEEKLPINPASGPRLPSKPSLSRRLQEIGRQSSSDSGIATGSHSSYSGSFSSYTGSLDTGSPREEYGTLLSLPPFSSPEKHQCTCPISHTHEYQVPSSLRYLYDTPRSLLEEAREQKEAAASEQTEETVKEQTEGSAAACSLPESPRDLGAQGSSSTDTHSDCLICCPHPASSRMLFTTCPICGGLKRAPLPMAGASLQHGVPAGGKSTSDASVLATNLEWNPRTDLSTQSLSFASSGTDNKLQEGSPKSYIDSLSDLLGHYSPGRTETVSIIPSLPDSVRLYCPPGNNSLGSAQSGSYIPMASTLTSPQCPSSCQVYPIIPSHPTSHSTNYENCLQCRKGQDGCMLPKAVPAVISSLMHPSGRKSTGGQGHFPFLQDLSASSWGLSSEIPPVEEPPHLPTLTSQPPLQLSDGETTVGDKKQRSHAERGRMDPAYEIMEGQATVRSSESDEKSRYELMSSSGQQRSTDDPEGGSGVSERPKGGATYVNIPISPKSKKQLHYMELELQEHGTTIKGKGTTKYAQIDITATETAHRVGTQHALGREAGLHKLEQWKRGGAPQ
ncbi:protein Dok-7 isoform X1 [Pangasianodon hypophthalmus]|uniref:protein Dok-7 isoform X1 n=1 Tax=Pangasianodon hypophthalmus TaxID=310915 RepID=UPI002307E4A5|nr:protein Dok-7 isoform X1 [Pangasianodon hypophthalmus]